MGQTVLLAFLAGLIGANSVPHFVRGITGERYPTVFGDSPVINVVAGWAGLVLTVLCVRWAHPDRAPDWALAAGASGVLLMGLFHARWGAFGRTGTGRTGTGRTGISGTSTGGTGARAVSGSPGGSP
ncbi:hypothetical protein [Spongiactinospora sp. TRM90649]|uniref:hypothetical protein n=1 Tax=Spongiactinospora sp. TRM90649 TaxID=3031114 RepID=UPI0023F96EBD|nr:hypothetical protein [Spongiactinospora sp. TRM90649]MDF5751423.1 hypothetical protein [Spongiactinospora sp. TRM90649]